MGSLLATQLLGRVSFLLNDNTNVIWSPPEVLGWINDGQRAIVTRLPQAYPKRVVFALTPNDVLQVLPANAFRLVSIKRNMGVNGTTPGRPILAISEMQLYNVDPTWPTTDGAADSQIKHYSYDPETPYTVWVYPRPSLPIQVEAWVSTMPDEITSMASPITLDDSFFNPLIDYVLSRCYQKNADVQGSPQMIAGYLASFDAQLTSRDTGDHETTANTASSRMTGALPR